MYVFINTLTKKYIPSSEIPLLVYPKQTHPLFFVLSFVKGPGAKALNLKYFYFILIPFDEYDK
jgi:hypothetical protein